MPHSITLMILPLSLAVVGCDVGTSRKPAESPAVVKIPEATCRQADVVLSGVQNQLMMDVDTFGEATLPKAAWQGLEGSARDQIFNAIGMKAACMATSSPAEQPVIIRNEFGDVQSERLVTIYERQNLD